MVAESKGSTLWVLNVDLSHEEEIIRAFQWAEDNIGGIDVLVNSAGIGGTSSLLGSYIIFFHSTRAVRFEN